MKYDYSKLRGRIREKFGTESAFAAYLGMNRATLSAKLNGRVQMDQYAIAVFCRALDIPTEQIGIYFFTVKVEKARQEEGVKSGKETV